MEIKIDDSNCNKNSRLLNKLEIEEIVNTRGLCLFESEFGSKVIIAKNVNENGFIIINTNGRCNTSRIQIKYRFLKELTEWGVLK